MHARCGYTRCELKGQHAQHNAPCARRNAHSDRDEGPGSRARNAARCVERRSCGSRWKSASLSNEPPSPRYRGRFAPSPTGRLHFGSLVAALGSWLMRAREPAGHWLVRVEDLDPPREVPGADADILATLAAFGMASDESVIYQSQRTATTNAHSSNCAALGDVYPCWCSRSDLAPFAGVHPAACVAPRDDAREPAWRLRVPERVIAFDDLIQGRYAQDLSRDVGDFVDTPRRRLVRLPARRRRRRCGARRHGCRPWRRSDRFDAAADCAAGTPRYCRAYATRICRWCSAKTDRSSASRNARRRSTRRSIAGVARRARISRSGGSRSERTIACHAGRGARSALDVRSIPATAPRAGAVCGAAEGRFMSARAQSPHPRDAESPRQRRRTP